MDSSLTTPPGSYQGPLGFMSKLSDKVYLYRPPSTTGSGGGGGASPPAGVPKLIVVFGWMDARDVHLAKYVIGHRALFPTSQILLVKDRLYHRFLSFAVARALKPAVAVLEAAQLSGDRTELLVHAFSNGGSAMLANLYRRCVLPPHVLVMDSCPGQFSYRRSLAVLSVGLPFWKRLLLVPVFHTFIVIYYLAFYVSPWARRRTTSLASNAAAHNDRSVKGDGERARAYIYSDVDEFIASRDVERHADQAKQMGLPVRLEKFVGSPHVAHMRTDEDRYWSIVQETWEEGQTKSN
ncbi:hypothetical protein MCOR25_002451 [Pyricularia grisea]|uniref:Uncharacterized protein n=1 Tax=Pyricularia grisea TaxID=148305 RepID=A0A6P8BLA5_PYRGI|nr:uncharacterized protein PgNI_00943 [Pyricularia grisea]KAI6377727.1 hypothetical protein MCOR25_002451 [Pyricularia grisea]TLD17474.1 hypothetical protein PgNI_00943 [Pyricularia grisea]